MYRMILSDHCFKEYVEYKNFTDEQCIKETGSTLLGLLVMFLSVFMKVPQLVKIRQNRSGEGINMKAVTMELLTLTTGASYAYTKGYPFNAWGEGMFMSLQQFAMTSLLLYYGSSTNRTLLFTATYVIAVLIVATKLIPLQVLWAIKASNLPLLLIGKLVQFSTNRTNGSTGQISALTTALTVFMCCVRVFTSLYTTGDVLLILTFSVAAFGNTLILGQLVWYWNVDKNKKA